MKNPIFLFNPVLSINTLRNGIGTQALRRIFFLLLLLCILFQAQAAVRYVTPGGSGNHSGSSWSNASGDLRAMINASNYGDKVWVAAGTYTPTTGTSRNIYFSMKNGVLILGGFNGTEISATQRDFMANVTILSGNIGNQDSNGDNSYHVIFNNNNGLNSSAVLDGFTITGGYASGSGSLSTYWGGGMYNSHSSPTIANCTFTENRANEGAGMYNSDYSSPTLFNCIFSGNKGVFGFNRGGGMLNRETSSPTLTNCAFLGNKADYSGGMGNGPSCSPTLINCSFSGNTGTGGAIRNSYIYNPNTNTNEYSSPTLINCIIWGNSSEITEANATTIINSIVQGGCPSNASCTNVLDIDPLFVDQPPVALGTSGDLHLQECSPAIDAGTSSNAPSYDFEGESRPKGDADDIGFDEKDAGPNPGSTWYFDNDGDGYSGSSVNACEQPANSFTLAELTGTNDCDDNDADEFPGQIWYHDFDGDGYRAVGGTLSCVRPPGHKTLDEFSNPAEIDCNDNDPSIHMIKTWYQDADDDGYSSGLTIFTCNQPTGFKLPAELVNTSDFDCDDNDPFSYPTAVEICDGADNNCDGQTDEGLTNTYYADNDSDGFGDPNITTNACNLPGGYVTDNTDCNDNDNYEFPGQTWYLDNDNDNYTEGTTQTACHRPSGYKAADELVNTIDLDCNDADANANPSPDCSSTIRTWTGNVDSNWETACNWSPSCVPSFANSIIIPDVANRPQINGAANANRVFVEENAQLTINSGGSLSIENSSNDGLEVDGMVVNDGIISIGQNGSNINHAGISISMGSLTNNSTGVINIDNTGRYGMEIGGDASLDNFGTISIGQNGGSTNIAYDGIWVSGTLDNSGVLNIDNTGENGLRGIASSIFHNTGTINIGQNGGAANIDSDGLNFVNNQFYNQVGGNINIDNVKDSGIFSNGYFSNEGNLNIGMNGGANNIGEDGISYYTRTFENKNGGIISIDNTEDDAIYTIVGATFINDFCAEVYLYRNLDITSTSNIFENNGLLYIDAGDGLSSNKVVNNGVIANIQGLAFGGTNNEIIVTPIADNCNEVNPAFQLGTTVDLNILGIFTDQNATNSAGSYEVNTNTFIPFIANGQHNLYVQIEDPANGCTRIISWSVDFGDSEAPVPVCSSKTIQLEANGGHTLVEADVLSGGTDNCGTVNFVSTSPSSFDCDDVGITFEVTVTVNDGNNNTAQCTANITIADDDNPCCEAPIAVCQSYIALLDASGQATISVTDVDGGSTADCGELSKVIDLTNFDCDDIANNPQLVTLTITDINGDSNNCTAEITVKDEMNPSLTCPADIDVAMDEGQCGASVSWTAPTATDNCDGNFTATQTTGAPSGSLFAAGTHTIEYTATDAANNAVTCSFTITVQSDAEVPVPLCKTNTPVVLDASGAYTIQEADVFDGGTDNCGTVSFQSASPATVSCLDMGSPVSVIVTANDEHGNTSSCTATVTVELASSCPSGTKTWTGLINNDWNVPCNWDPICVPTVNDDVIIPAVTNDPIISGTTAAVAKSISVESGGNLSINTNGSLSITGANVDGLTCDGTVENRGTIVIDGAEKQGINNYGTITNDGGTIDIDNIEEDDGIENKGNFINKNGGVINILRLLDAEASGISNRGAFNNSATINTGQVYQIGLGISTYDGSFNNTTNGVCNIDRTNFRAVQNWVDGTFNNNGGKLYIGQNAGSNNIKGEGIYSRNTFTNSNGGVIYVDNTKLEGMVVVGSTFPTSTTSVFTNSASIFIGKNSSIDATGLLIENSGILNNLPCGVIQLHDNLDNNGVFTNDGLITLNTIEVHTPGTFTNHGIIEDIQGTFSGGINNEIIVVPVTSNCNEVSPAFQLGAVVDFNILGIFTDENATLSAGTYNVNTNTFSPSVGGGSLTLYVQIEDPANGCTRNVVWVVDFGDETPPVPDLATLPDATGECEVTVSTPTATDNCAGFVQATTSDPTTYTEQGTYTITWTYEDGNGNSLEQVQTVIVNDKTPPTAICQDVTVLLDANGQATLSAVNVDNGSFDNCGIADLSLDNSTFDCSDVEGGQATAKTSVAANGSNNYSVIIQLSPTLVNAPGSCNYGYGYTVNIDYHVSFTGNAPAGGLYTLQGTLSCDPANSFFPILNDNQFVNNGTTTAGTTTTSNAWNPATDCADVTAQSLGCDQISLQIQGPGIPYQVISLPLSYFSTQTVALTVTDIGGNSSNCTAEIAIEQGINLPDAWEFDDVGTGFGDVIFDPCSDEFILYSNGPSTFANDRHHFAYQEICGDVEIVLHLKEIETPGWAGPEIRESLDANAKMANITTSLGNIIHRKIRTSTGAFAAAGQIFKPQHSWLKLVRSGSSIMGFSSYDGLNWSIVLNTNINFSDCVYLGLFAESNNPNILTTAIFDQVMITPLSGNLNLRGLTNGSQIIDNLEQTDHVSLDIAPNPFTRLTSIELQLEHAGPVSLEIFNLQGQKVKMLDAGFLEAGTHIYDWDGTAENGQKLEAGTYLVRIQSGKEVLTKKVSFIQ